MRLFIAIPIPESAREHLVELQNPMEGVRWEQAKKLHLTLKFLGDTEPDRVQDLKATLDRIGIAPFSITFKGFGYFPKGQQPRVLWAGIRENKSLQELYQKIEDRCTDLGFEPEHRSFKPHVTIARVDGTPKHEVISFINKHKQFQLPGVPVEKFVLYESKLHPDGAEHSRLKTFPLEG